jgi:succinate dehydrogenase / fumarate reductase membrane anchor subunit
MVEGVVMSGDKSASRHWTQERLTSLANIPLMLWLVWSVVRLLPLSYGEFVEWLREPLHAGLMIASLISVFYHTTLGAQVIAEDYIHDHAKLKTTLAVLRLYFGVAGLIGVISALKVAL